MARRIVSLAPMFEQTFKNIDDILHKDDAAKAHFDEREMVELTATIAAYNLVSRFLEAMQIDHDK